MSYFNDIKAIKQVIDKNKNFKLEYLTFKMVFSLSINFLLYVYDFYLFTCILYFINFGLNFKLILFNKFIVVVVFLRLLANRLPNYYKRREPFYSE